MARLPWSPPAWYLLAMHLRLASFILFCGHDKHQAVISLLGHSYTHPLSSILSTYGTRFYATAIISVAGAFRRIPLFLLNQCSTISAQKLNMVCSFVLFCDIGTRSNDELSTLPTAACHDRTRPRDTRWRR